MSWTPGADGAPLEGVVEEVGAVWRFVVDVAWPDAGTIRRALGDGQGELVLGPGCASTVLMRVQQQILGSYHLGRTCWWKQVKVRH